MLSPQKQKGMPRGRTRLEARAEEKLGSRMAQESCQAAWYTELLISCKDTLFTTSNSTAQSFIINELLLSAPLLKYMAFIILCCQEEQKQQPRPLRYQADQRPLVSASSEYRVVLFMGILFPSVPRVWGQQLAESKHTQLLAREPMWCRGWREGLGFGRRAIADWVTLGQSFQTENSKCAFSEGKVRMSQMVQV